MAFPASDWQNLKLEDGRTISLIVDPDIPIEEFRCPDHKWGQQPVPISAGGGDLVLPGDRGTTRPEFFYKPFVAADVRRDGVTRLYGRLIPGRGDRNDLFELWHSKSGWRIDTIFPATLRSWTLWGLPFAVGDARNDGGISLLVQNFGKIAESRWDGTKWEVTPFQLFHEAAGIVVGAFRPDRLNRLYATSANHVREHTFQDGVWRHEEILSPAGRIDSLISGQVSGLSTNNLFFAGEGGLYRLLWTEGEGIVVLDFRQAERDEGDRSTSDKLRQLLVQQGNCRIVERESIAAVLSEQRLQLTGAVSPESAVKIGKLLRAEKVVLGSEERLLDSTAAVVRIVSVATGQVGRSDAFEWSSAEELEVKLEKTARYLCPASDRGAK